jgi:threonylcarbamoyladenosine tRNA methylthiotransferase MtaB
VVIVNTCSVTAEADRSARAFIRRVHRVNPEAQILVTGCYAQRAPEELAGLPGVAAVVGNSHKALAPAIAMDLARGTSPGAGVETPAELVPIRSLLAANGHAPIWADDHFAHSFLEEAQLVPGTQTRPNLKIQEGCSNRCTFCVIPQTRGSSRSLAAAAVLRQVAGFVAAGGKELVLSGINLGRWGRDLPPDAGYPARSLPRLLRRIFGETELRRLRLSSIEPMDWDADLVGVMREFGGTRLARHAHLPLQSGCDAVLRRMHRRYRPWHYAEKAAALMDAAGPGLTLGADVMVGFPGESDREFEETCEFVRALPFGYLHLFPFSPRPGTRGWSVHAESPVPAKVVEERMAALMALAAEKSETHRRCFIGREVDAITLRTPPGVQALGLTTALTENFLPVEIDSHLGANRLVRVHVTAVDSDLTLRAATVHTLPDQSIATEMLA